HDGVSHKLSNLGAVPHLRVFNSDFVEDNVFFRTGQAKPILVLGSEDHARLVALEEKRGALAAVRQRLQESSTRQDTLRQSYDTALTGAARSVKTSLREPSYDRTRLQPWVDKAKDDTTPLLSEAEYSSQVDLASATKKRDEIHWQDWSNYDIE